MGRRARILVTAAVLGALIAPVVANCDGYPLSTYPMYSRARASMVSLVTAQAVGADGARSTLSLAVIGRSDDPLIVAGELRAAIADDRAAARCAEIAARAASWNGLAAGVASIEIVTERRDVVAQVSGTSGEVDRTVHASCPVSS